MARPRRGSAARRGRSLRRRTGRRRGRPRRARVAARRAQGAGSRGLRPRPRSGGGRGRDRGPPRGASRGDRQPPQPRAGASGDHDRRPAADPGWRRVGQDARHRPPHRVPDRRQGRPAPSDPGRDVHQPGGRRAPRADHRPRRRARQGRPGGHVPRPVRARPPPGRRGDRARPAVRHLRHRRPAAADEADPGRGGPAGDRRVPAGRHPGRDQPGEERDARRDVPRRERRQPPRADHRPPGRSLPRPAARRQRPRLRRPAAAGGRPVRAVAGGARQVPRAVALPARRRVPGHEPAAVPVDPGAGIGASQPVRGGGRRPVDLRLAGRERPEHPRLRARLPRGDRGQARAELPLDAADPRRRARASCRATSAGPTRSCGPRTRAACRSSASRPSTRRRRPSGSPARSKAWWARPAAVRG